MTSVSSWHVREAIRRFDVLFSFLLLCLALSLSLFSTPPNKLGPLKVDATTCCGPLPEIEPPKRLSVENRLSVSRAISNEQRGCLP